MEFGNEVTNYMHLLHVLRVAIESDHAANSCAGHYVAGLQHAVRVSTDMKTAYQIQVEQLSLHKDSTLTISQCQCFPRFYKTSTQHDACILLGNLDLVEQ
ncbi:unnamed protein product [Amoebophrya sp. A25]|nr:unnamed protein product [Amoebophrya sp. A25]|eukprot:GSA25T00013408001.1